MGGVIMGVAMAAMVATLALSACFAHVPLRFRIDRLAVLRLRPWMLRQGWAHPLPVRTGAVAAALAAGVVGAVIEGQCLPEVVAGRDRLAS